MNVVIAKIVSCCDVQGQQTSMQVTDSTAPAAQLSSPHLLPLPDSVKRLVFEDDVFVGFVFMAFSVITLRAGLFRR